mgnify:CR=1 FL=1
MLYKKRILVTPLNWGLGHATRCIPIIHELLKQGAEVIIAADQLPLHLLRTEFPDLEFVTFPGLEIKYKSNTSLVFNMALQANKFYKAFAEEHLVLKKVVENYAIDAVISDNRYGAYSDVIPSILITHQVFLSLPIGEIVMEKVIKKYLSKFDECWIPDFEGAKNLSGLLSHKKSLPKNYHFIGPLSRFAWQGDQKHVIKRKLMVVLSGPEPNRSDLEEKLFDELQNVDFDVLMVRGSLKELQIQDYNPHLKVEPVLTSAQLYKEMSSSELILCRSGYSSIMDLAALGKKAILIPTKGQTEQEYLAEKLKEEKVFYAVDEKDLNLQKALQESKKYSGLQLQFDNTLLLERLKKLVDHSKK